MIAQGTAQRRPGLLSLVPFKGMRTDAKALLRAGRLRAILGMDQVLEFLYQARRAGFTSPETHGTYAMLAVAREQIENVKLTCDVVELGCAVLVEMGNEKQWYTILDEPDLHPERGEISVQQARGMQLLGRRKDESFVFRKDAFGRDDECKIVEILNKHVRAFHETLERFSSLFPTDSTLQPIKAPYEEMRDGMLRQIDEQHEALRKLRDLYEARKITFEAMAKLLHKSPLDFRSIVTSGHYFPLFTFSGAPPDARAELNVARESENLLVDLLALLTFTDLKLLAQLKSRYRLVTTQPVLDALTEAHAEIAVSKPHMSLGKIGGDYIRQEITAEQLASNKVWLENLLTFIDQNVTVVRVGSLLEAESPKPELRELLGPISTASIFAAREHGLPLYSEDQMLRALAYLRDSIRSPLVIQEHRASYGGRSDRRLSRPFRAELMGGC